MIVSRFFVAMVVALVVAVLSPSALAAPAPGAGWRLAIERIAEAVAVVPPGLAVRSLAVAEIRESRTLARWPLSDHLERALTEAIAAKSPPYVLLGRSPGDDLGLSTPSKAASDGRAPGLPAGHNAVLTGTFARDAQGAVRVDLQVRDLQNRATLYALAPVTIASTDLPARVEPETGFGKLVLDVEPAAALVYVDGEPVGRGSVAVPVPLGSHVVTVAAEGYEVFDDTVEIKIGAPVALAVRLKRPSLLVTITANVPDATVKVDDEERGATPLSISGLAPGKHRIAIFKEGHKPFETHLDWSGSKPQFFKAFLLPLPGSLLVTADVGDARIDLDGAEAGRAPTLLQDLHPGMHKLRVTAGNRSPFEKDVEVRTARTTHIRALLAAEPSGEAEPFEGLAVVPRTHHRDDVALASQVQKQLRERHPETALADPIESLRLARATFPEDQRTADPDLVRNLAVTIRARQVAVVGVLEQVPFTRFAGMWPLRPRISGELALFQSSGPRSPQVSRIEAEGGEPWLGSSHAPDQLALSIALAAEISDRLVGRSGGPKPAAVGGPLLNSASALLGDMRPSSGYGMVAGGFLYERRVLDWMEMGDGYAIGNAMGNDLKKGSQLYFVGAGNYLGSGSARTTRSGSMRWPASMAPPPQRVPGTRGHVWRHTSARGSA